MTFPAGILASSRVAPSGGGGPGSPELTLLASSLSLGDGDPVATWIDTSGNSRHFTQSDSAKRPLYRAGSGSPYLEFDGTDDVFSPALTWPATQTAYTIWVRAYSNVAGYRNLWDGVNFGNTDSRGNNVSPMLWFDSSSKLEFNGGAGGGTIHTSASAYATQWFTACATFSGGASGTLNYYVNGSLAATKTGQEGLPADAAGLTIPFFGSRRGVVWNGRVSGLRVWYSELTNTDVASLG